MAITKHSEIIRIGTRSSQLALWQAHFVADLLNKGGFQTEIMLIETKGDKILNTSLAKIGSKGIFTAELEEQLHTQAIDIAVHSAKDLQSVLPDDLEIIAFTQREKVNDVLLSYDKNLPSLGAGITFTVGTSSTRRVAMLRHFFPHIQTVDMRGNLQTRRQKLQNGVCDALLLAYAGVHRMNFDEMIVDFLPEETFTPAVGQGSVAIECSKNLNATKKQIIKALVNDTDTEICLLAERAFLATLQGGCSIPVFGLATLQDEKIQLSGGIVSLDGKKMLRETFSGEKNQPEILGKNLAEKILSSGGEVILQEIKSGLRKV
jgi:hydroxymethylbilane synthase